MRRGAIPFIICCLIASGRGDARAQSRPVGPLGAPSRIQVVGIDSAPAKQVVAALLHDPDVAYASFPDAPLAELEYLLGEKTVAGLRNSGFPYPRLSIVDRVDHLELLVQEGPRWAAGDVHVFGAKVVDVGKLREGLAPAGPFPGKSPTAKESGWTIARPARLGEPSRRRLSRRVKELLADQGFPAAKFTVNIVGAPNRHTATLRIIIDDEGSPLRLRDVQFTGNKLHSREQILTYLQMPAETILSTEVRREIEKRLVTSGRFTKCKFEGPSSEAPPRFAVDEFLEAPRLDQPLTPEENALLKLSNWIGAFERQDEELVAFMDLGDQWLELTMSPQHGFLALLGTQPRDSGRFDLAVFLSEQQAGIYSTKSGRKLEAKTWATSLTSWGNFTLLQGAPNWQQAGTYDFGVGFASAAKKGRQPHAQIEPILSAAAALSVICKHHARCQWDGPILSAQWEDHTLRVDSRDGRLVDLRIAEKRSWFWWLKPSGAKDKTNMATVEGHFGKRLAQIEQATASFPNMADGRRPASCLIEFLCQEPIAQLLNIEKETLVIATVDRLSQRGMLRALDDLVLETNDDQQDEFLVPPDTPSNNEHWYLSTGLSAGAKAMTTRMAIPWSDALFVRGSRPWLAWREAAFIMSGKTAHLDERLARLFPADDDGPLMDLALAEAMTSAGLTEEARTWAERGLEDLSVEAFRRDYADFLAPASPASGYLVGMADALRGLDRTQSKAVCKYLSKKRWLSESDSSGALLFLNELRADPDRPTADALSAALEELWQSTLEQKVMERLQAISSAAPQSDQQQPQVRRRKRRQRRDARRAFDKDQFLVGGEIGELLHEAGRPADAELLDVLVGAETENELALVAGLIAVAAQ